MSYSVDWLELLLHDIFLQSEYTLYLTLVQSHIHHHTARNTTHKMWINQWLKIVPTSAFHFCLRISIHGLLLILGLGCCGSRFCKVVQNSFDIFQLSVESFGEWILPSSSVPSSPETLCMMPPLLTSHQSVYHFYPTLEQALEIQLWQ